MKRLEKVLQRVDGKGYKAYGEIEGRYSADWFTFHIDYVQGDPFAQPSRLRMVVPRSSTAIQLSWFSTRSRMIALTDFVTRAIARTLAKRKRKVGGSGGSGLIAIDGPGQEMLWRSSVRISAEVLDIRLSVGLPATGRRILGRKAIELLCEEIPDVIRESVFHLDRSRLWQQIKLADQQDAIRSFLREKGWVAFVANGSILPRESGVSNLPLSRHKAIPFQSPKTLEVEIPLPHQETIRGMAVRSGVTLIVGGGYHGKSTLLQAIERGVYNHVWGDGREFVITEDTANKVRAEDGRSVTMVDISPFISNLPLGKDTHRFCSDDASGSTSQATNIMEALEMGSRLLLMDEDTSATNFMIRDVRMQRLVKKQKEPITPFIDKVKSLYDQYGVSTILVIGGSGDYLPIADTVIMMDSYQPSEVTDEAHEIAKRYGSDRIGEGGERFGWISARRVLASSFCARRGRRERVKTRGIDQIIYGEDEIDLSAVEQLVDDSQTRAIANMMRYLAQYTLNGAMTLRQAIDEMYDHIEQRGLDEISPYKGKHPGDLALPRKNELASAINRLRVLKVQA